MSFQKDYFLSTDYTVDCTTGLIKPTGSAPVIAANLQRKTQLTQGFSPRYDFISGNIVDTQMNNAKVGTIPSTCSTYEFDDDGKWGPAYSRKNRDPTVKSTEGTTASSNKSQTTGGSTSGSVSSTAATSGSTAGSAAGSGTGTSLNYVANAGLKPSLSTCKQYYKVGWY